ncbi:MFS general substrate transporter [Gigaspora margarita]|uniref:Autophagy-related protein n=1 Tax=Gigaspora margarita TaxID=4874 RepID=A0A8H4ETX8_GIGMA|nr:MFS general substrate transporter [Gigaspora margarita]
MDTLGEDYEKVQNEDEPNPLTKKELIGWYFHNFAIGGYDTAAISVFIPVVLEGLSSQAGYELDQVTPCNTTVTDYECVTRFGTSFVDTESYSLYLISVSVLFQAILFISCGSLADHGNSRKKFLLSFSFVGAISTIAFVTIVNPKLYWLAGLFTIISNCCFGAAFLFFLAYIPIFSRCHPDVIKAKISNASIAEVKTLMDIIATKLSSYSMAADLISGLIVIIAGLGLVLVTTEGPAGFQFALAFCGAWWLLFLIFPAMWLTSRPRPPLPKNENNLLYSWKRVGKTLMSSRELWQTMKFLFAYFFISDGMNTLVTVCVLFGKKELGMTNIELSLFAIIVPICAVIGIYLLLFIQKKFQLSIKTMIILESIGISLLPLYAILGFWLPFGLVNKWEVWMYLVLFGLLVGSIQGYCQACFAIIIPEGHENEFFSLYQITSKGSSAIGPLISGAITNYTHHIRFCYWFLFALIASPIFILATLDIEKGKSDAKMFVKKEEETKNKDIRVD